jgi:hypothetical protein
MATTATTTATDYNIYCWFANLISENLGANAIKLATDSGAK